MLLWFKGLSLGGKLAIVLALVAASAALMIGFNRWKEGIREDGRNEVRAQWAAARAARATVMADFQKGIAAALKPNFDRLASTIGNIDRQGAEINVRLPQAIAADPRYRDASCALTPDVLTQVNAARALSAPAGEAVR